MEPIFTECLLCARHCCRCFPGINSLVPETTLWIIPILQMITLRHRPISTLPTSLNRTVTELAFEPRIESGSDHPHLTRCFIVPEWTYSYIDFSFLRWSDGNFKAFPKVCLAAQCSSTTSSASWLMETKCLALSTHVPSQVPPSWGRPLLHAGPLTSITLLVTIAGPLEATPLDKGE